MRLIILSLLLCGCGADIDYHTVSREQLDVIAGPQYLGWCDWKTQFGEIVEADIYLMSIENYPSEPCYFAMLRHEEKHAEKGDWHKGVFYIEPECQ